MKKRIVLTLVVGVLTLMLCGIALALHLINKPPINAGNLPPAFRVDATSLFREYSRNEAAANQKFVDKIIEVKCVILDREENDSTMSVLLDTGNPAMGADSLSYTYKDVQWLFSTRENMKVKEGWTKNQQAFIEKADKQWPELKGK